MTHDIDAVFDGGVFRPIEPVVLPDGTRVHVRLEAENGAEKYQPPHSAGQSQTSPTELADFRRVMAELPIESANDGFSGTDHDQILYGQP